MRANPKLAQRLKEMIDERGLDTDIQVDGGINLDTIGIASSAGANVFVAGSAIFYSQNYAETIQMLRERMVDPLKPDQK